MLFRPDRIALTGFAPSARAGLATLLPLLAADAAIPRLTCAAYMLATAEWETWHTFAPVEEAGRGVGKPYGAPVAVPLPDGTTTHNTYYGRGYVQLTWATNYAKMARLTGADLVGQPDLALDPEIAAVILLEGMKGGLFTGVGLPRYFSDAVDDPVGARRIINGTDHAADIAAIHAGFLAGLS